MISLETLEVNERWPFIGWSSSEFLIFCSLVSQIGNANGARHSDGPLTAITYSP